MSLDPEEVLKSLDKARATLNEARSSMLSGDWSEAYHKIDAAVNELLEIIESMEEWE